MWNPTHIDGRTAVWLVRQRHISNYVPTESGILEYDGETLRLLRPDGTQRIVEDRERDELLPVADGNRIPACNGFDFFHFDHDAMV